MKKLLTLSLCAILLLSLTACSSSEEETTTTEDTTSSQNTDTTNDTATQESPYDVNEIVAKINEVNVMNPTKDIDDDTMALNGLDETIYNSYAGTYYPVTPGVGMTLVVEALEGKVADVETALKSWQDYLYSSNENYPGTITEKIENSRIVTKGNYVIFVIAVDNGQEDQADMSEVYENIDIAIDEFFK